MKKINQLESLRVMKAVVEGGSFTVASQHLGVSVARVSKSIEQLEIELGTVLFNRSTRQMQITNSGEHCYASALALINQWKDLKEELVVSQTNPKGKLRISAPMTWGLVELMPLLDDFMRKYPQIKLDVQMSDQQVNVLAEEFDLVLRLAHQLTDSSLICRKIIDYQMVACASPEYLEHHGTPKHPADLKKHACLMYSPTKNPRKWQFLEGNKTLNIYLEPRLLSNNSKLLHSALLNAQGIALIPDFIVQQDISANRLLTVLDDYNTLNLNLYALRPSNRLPSQRLTLLHDYLCDKLQD